MCVLHTEMRVFTGLLMLLASSAYGLNSICGQDAACYGALGGRVYLQLMRNTRGHELTFRNEQEIIFRFRNSNSKTTFNGNFNTPSFLQRWQFVPDNGTLIINPAEKRDSGTYRVEIHNSSGKLVGDQTVQLIIEVPVSVVNLSISCSTNGKRIARCSSNGDNPQYSWFLDGRPLGEILTNHTIENLTKHTPNTAQNTQAKDAPSNKTSPNTQEAPKLRASPTLSTDPTLTLPEATQGSLTCSATNHIASANSTQLLPTCTTTTTPAATTPLSTVSSSSSVTVATPNQTSNSIMISMTTSNSTFSKSNSTTVEPFDFFFNKFPIPLGAAVLGGVFFLCLSMVVFCICKRKKKSTPAPDDQLQDVVYSQCRVKPASPPGDSSDVEYAEVSILKKRREEWRREEEKVEYGEVRRPADTTHTQQEDSVYAQVRKGQ